MKDKMIASHLEQFKGKRITGFVINDIYPYWTCGHEDYCLHVHEASWKEFYSREEAIYSGLKFLSDDDCVLAPFIWRDATVTQSDEATTITIYGNGDRRIQLIYTPTNVELMRFHDHGHGRDIALISRNDSVAALARRVEDLHYAKFWRTVRQNLKITVKKNRVMFTIRGDWERNGEISTFDVPERKQQAFLQECLERGIPRNWNGCAVW